MRRLKPAVVLFVLVLFALTSQGCIAVLVVSEAGVVGAAAVATAVAAGATVIVPP